MSNDQTSDPTGGTPGSGPADDQPTQAMPPTPGTPAADPTQTMPAQPGYAAAPPAAAPQGHGPQGGYAARPGYAPQPQAGYPAPVGAAPASATAPRTGRRAGWIIGGAVAGVLLLGGATAFGVAIARDDDPVIVHRADTGAGQVRSGHMNGGANGGTGSQSGGSGQAQGGTEQGTTGDGSTGTGSGGTDDSGGTAGGAGSTWNHHVDPDDIELYGDILEQASAAALAAAGEGVITSAEHSDDPTHVYEIEVTRDDGAEMELYLDADFQVIASKPWHH